MRIKAIPHGCDKETALRRLARVRDPKPPLHRALRERKPREDHHAIIFGASGAVWPTVAIQR